MDNLSPIYRIEFFLDAIVNGSQHDLDPIYRVEFFLAKIAGAAVEIPQPLSRMEMFLAQLCGESLTLPTPQSRTEQYLAAICGEDVEIPPFPAYRIEYWLDQWAQGGGGSYITLIGDIVRFMASRSAPFRTLQIALEPIQAGSGDPSPDNVRPISGRTSATVYHSGADTSDPTTYTIQLGDTVYGGTLDVLTGVLTVTHAFGTYNGSENWQLGTAYMLLWGQPPSKSNTDTTQIANWLVGGGGSYAEPGMFRVQTNGALCVGNRGGAYADVAAFKAVLAETPLQVCYELATPITITLSSQAINSLVGENNVWDDGTVTIEVKGEAIT